MADFWWGFQGTVDEVQWAKLIAGMGQKYTLVNGDPVRSTGRTLYIDPRMQIGCGVAFEHDAVKSVSVPTPAAGQWHLLVARRTWGASPSVAYVLVPGATTADAVQTVPPTTLPAGRNKTPGLVDDEPVAWVHTRQSTTTLTIFQMSVRRDGRVPGLWALYDPAEQGIYRAYSEAGTGGYVWDGTAWVTAGGGLLAAGTITAQSSIVIDGLTGADRYEITLHLPTASTANDLTAQLRSGGVTNTAAAYDRQVLTGAASAAVAAELLGNTSWSTLSATNRTDKTIRILLMNLNRAERTIAEVSSEAWNASGNPNLSVLGLRHRTAASMDGIVFATTAGTVTGRYEVRAL